MSWLLHGCTCISTTSQFIVQDMLRQLRWPGCLLFIYLWFYVAFNTVHVISRQVVGRAEDTSTYSLSGFCTVNCRPTVSNYQLSHLRPCLEPNPGLRGGRREYYHSATVALSFIYKILLQNPRLEPHVS